MALEIPMNVRQLKQEYAGSACKGGKNRTYHKAR